MRVASQQDGRNHAAIGWTLVKQYNTRKDAIFDFRVSVFCQQHQLEKSLGSISAKNYQNRNRLMFVEVIASQRCDFFDPQCIVSSLEANSSFLYRVMQISAPMSVKLCPKLVKIIRLRRSTTYVDDAYCYRPSSVVCRSVCRSICLSAKVSH